MRFYRTIGVVLAFLTLLPLLIVPAYFGLTLSDGTLELAGHEIPEDPTEHLTFRLLDIYYFTFLMISILPFLVLVYWAFISRSIEKRKRARGRKNRKLKLSGLFQDSRFPLVSVIIPCYNEDLYLGSAIKNAYDQTYPGRMEIIVVDDGSKDNTWSIGRIFNTVKGKRTVSIHHKKNGGKASALEYGISKAEGRILIMTDGDSEMDQNAVREIVETFRDHPDSGIVGGFVSIKNTSSGNLTKLQQMEYHITQHIVRSNQSDDGSVLIAPGPIFGMRADIARMLPPLDRTIVEDCDLTMSVLPTGYTTRSTSKSVSYTNAPETWKQWIHQRRRWIYGQFQAWRENRWHLKKNPWGIYTYFTWVTTSISALLFFAGVIWTIALISMGSEYYSILEFVSLRTLLVAIIYILSRSMILLSYRDTRPLLLFLPLKVIYDLINGYLTCYLYIRYILRIGIKMKWGNRERVIH